MYRLLILLGLSNILFAQDKENFLTPQYYLAEENSTLKNELDNYMYWAQKIQFQHPLEDSTGYIPDCFIPYFGKFGAGKGPSRTEQHHAAIDYKIGENKTKVNIYAAHDGIVHVFRDAPKYRHYISVTTDVKDETGVVLGKLVSVYGHVDLDQDSALQILLEGKTVKCGELISKNLYSGTRGGPHLHFEIRYYRPGDKGTEEFYGFKRKDAQMTGTIQSAGIWEYGVWNPNVGYGYAHPENHF